MGETVLTGRRAMWGAGAGVVLAAASSALINELQAGWPWWVAAALVVLASAVLAGWLAADGKAAKKADGKASKPSLRVGRAAIYAPRDVRVGTGGTLKTGTGARTPPGRRRGGTDPDVDTGDGSIVSGRDLIVDGTVDTTGASGDGLL